MKPPKDSLSNFIANKIKAGKIAMSVESIYIHDTPIALAIQVSGFLTWDERGNLVKAMRKMEVG